MSEGPPEPAPDRYPPTSHLPVSGWLPDESDHPTDHPTYRHPTVPGTGARPNRTVLGSIVVIVAVVLAVVVVVLTNRGRHPADPTGTARAAATSAPAATTTPPTSSPSSTVDTTGWQQVPGTAGTGLTYSVPDDWRPSSRSRSTGRGDRWGGVAEVGSFPCADVTYTRGFVASGTPPASDADDPGAAATGYARALAEHWYPSPQVRLGDPQPRTVDGHAAVLVTAQVTATPEQPRCDATSAEVVVLAVRVDGGTGVVAAVNDLRGGPADPACTPDAVIQQIMNTVHVQ